MKQYVYRFVPWPDETGDHRRSLFDLFRVLTSRVEMRFTEKEFDTFRSELAMAGFTLREVTRRLNVPEESVG